LRDTGDLAFIYSVEILDCYSQQAGAFAHDPGCRFVFVVLDVGQMRPRDSDPPGHLVLGYSPRPAYFGQTIGHTFPPFRIFHYFVLNTYIIGLLVFLMGKCRLFHTKNIWSKNPERWPRRPLGAGIIPISRVFVERSWAQLPPGQDYAGVAINNWRKEGACAQAPEK
jgi:hypothetical protein